MTEAIDISAARPTASERAAAVRQGAALMSDRRLRRPSGIRSLRLGELKITYVPDGVAQLRPRGWLPATTGGDWAEHAEYLNDTGHLVAGVGGLLVEYGRRALLIDAGFGPRAVPEDPDHPLIGAIHGGALLDNLERIGRAPGEIEAVAFTHLHPDHLGWACVAPGVFTGADFLVSEQEWTGRHLAAAHGVTAGMLAAITLRLRLVREGEEIFPGVRTLAMPGHTAGHTAYTITSGGQRLIAFGDALHSPIQVRHPAWSAATDHDPALSARQRHRLLAELQRPDTLGFGVHFADMVFGRVHQDADGATWQPHP
ncbi:MBL fold metallo-hydrolase [Streptosporangium roseum]|uniref:MBL fold metallo-hydrolase n=1 Tax=Streptosporangium roseum TaxID=2001 RepID=UPI003331D759